MKKSTEILELLSRHPQLSITEITELSNNGKPNTIYVAVRRLESSGYVKTWTEPRTPPAIGSELRVVAISDKGKKYLEVVR